MAITQTQYPDDAGRTRSAVTITCDRRAAARCRALAPYDSRVPAGIEVRAVATAVDHRWRPWRAADGTLRFACPACAATLPAPPAR